MGRPVAAISYMSVLLISSKVKIYERIAKNRAIFIYLLLGA